MMDKKEKPACIGCGSMEVIPIIASGYYGFEAAELKSRGLIEGKDFIDTGRSEYRDLWCCKKCGQRFRDGQMEIKKHLLFVCTAGVDRSPAAAALFDNSDKYESTSAGISPVAGNDISKAEVLWADVIFVMEHEHKRFILDNFKEEIKDKPEIIVLDVSDDFCRHDEELERLLRIRLEKEGFL